MRSFSILTVCLLLAGALAGCAADTPAPAGSDEPSARAYEALGFDGSTWPRLDGVTLTVLDHGAFGAFDDAAALFENLTGARVVHVSAGDAGGVLNRAVQERGDPTFDVLYGIDNVLYARAAEAGVFEPYRPVLADRIVERALFFGNASDASWHATPVDQGYVAVNWDPAHPALTNGSLETLDDVKTHADLFVTQDPRTSSPGLGFLLATIATYPEDSDYPWKQYWQDLFAGGVVVTSGWTEAYENRFSAGYGADYGGQADLPIVTSYTSSPAYESYFGREESRLARVVTAPQSTFHQVETMGIAKGTKNLAAAQAWIEFTLTDDFQALLAPGMAVYPVVETVGVEETFGGRDPAPSTLQPADLGYERIGANVERWIGEWTDLCEAADCA